MAARTLDKLALLALLALLSAAAAASETFKVDNLLVAGASCQKEISPILRACPASPAACAAARYELRMYCGRELPFDGSRECQAALRQVSVDCGP